jgi:hypothetical protein
LGILFGMLGIAASLMPLSRTKSNLPAQTNIR